MAKFNKTAGVLFVEGTHQIKTYLDTAVLITLSNVWDIKFHPSHQSSGVEYYTMDVYYTRNETMRQIMITEKEYQQIQTLIGGGPY